MMASKITGFNPQKSDIKPYPSVSNIFLNTRTAITEIKAIRELKKSWLFRLIGRVACN
jgi:hypothetical protein